jgi:hypothetical protein
LFFLFLFLFLFFFISVFIFYFSKFFLVLIVLLLVPPSFLRSLLPLLQDLRKAGIPESVILRYKPEVMSVLGIYARNRWGLKISRFTDGADKEKENDPHNR